MNRSGVYIALATFNGERYLLDQIQSIRRQSFKDWTLLVSDDGSDDQTIEIVRAQMGEDSRIELLATRSGKAGHVGNFEYLLEKVIQRHGEFVFLADQDDVWEPEKLALHMAMLEQGPEQTSAIFSDLRIMDSAGNRFGSFLQSHGLSGHYDAANILRTNFAVGCSMSVTADLLRLALPFPSNLENHDWWLGLCAAAIGRLGFSPKQLVNYRQHADNTIGVKNYRMQLLRLGPIIRRQRRVFDSKVTAVDELVQRLRAAGAQPPEVLLAWQKQFSRARQWQKPWQLLCSDFKPKSRALLLIQLLAVSPLIKR